MVCDVRQGQMEVVRPSLRGNPSALRKTMDGT